MKFKNIAITNKHNEILKFNPLDINKIIITTNKISIYQIEKNYINPKQHILNKEDFHYILWRGFIDKLRMIFEGV